MQCVRDVYSQSPLNMPPPIIQTLGATVKPNMKVSRKRQLAQLRRFLNTALNILTVQNCVQVKMYPIYRFHSTLDINTYTFTTVL